MINKLLCALFGHKQGAYMYLGATYWDDCARCGMEGSSPYIPPEPEGPKVRKKPDGRWEKYCCSGCHGCCGLGWGDYPDKESSVTSLIPNKGPDNG